MKAIFYALAVVALFITDAQSQSQFFPNRAMLDRTFASNPATVALGGILTAGQTMAFAAAAAADEVPARTNTDAITIGFTTATILPHTTGKITIALPAGYFSAADNTKANTFKTGGASSSATAKCTRTGGAAGITVLGIAGADTLVCTLEASNNLAAGAQVMTLIAGAVTTGASPLAAGTYNVATSMDRQLASPAATVALGGLLTAGQTMTITNVGGTIGSAKMLDGNITVGFTVATPVPIGGKIILTLPLNYFHSVDATKVNKLTTTSATCTCVLTKANQTLSETVDTVTCTTAGAILAAAAQTLIFVTGSVRIGDSQAANTYNVRTSTDLALASPPATVALGGVLTAGVAIAFTTATDSTPGTLNTGTVTLGFTVTNVVPIGGAIAIALPLHYFSAIDSAKVNTLGNATGVLSTCTCTLTKAFMTNRDLVSCTVAGAALKAQAYTLTFIAGSVTTGNPQVASTFMASTYSDLPFVPSSPVPAGPSSSNSSASRFMISAVLAAASLACALLF